MKSKNKMDYSKLDIESVKVANEMYKNIKDEGEKMSAKFNFYKGFNKALELIKKQQEQMYSEEDMRKAFIAGGNSCIEEDDVYGSLYNAYMEDWFEQFSKLKNG